jgi:hypothetical protein
MIFILHISTHFGSKLNGMHWSSFRPCDNYLRSIAKCRPQEYISSKRAWTPVGNSREENVLSRMAELADPRPEVHDKLLGYTQYNVGGVHQGTNACLAIVGKIISMVLQGAVTLLSLLSTNCLRTVFADKVQEWSRLTHTRALEAQAYLPEALVRDGCERVRCQTLPAIVEMQEYTLSRILCAHEHPCAFVVTAQRPPNEDKLLIDDVSYSFTVLCAGGVMAALEPHVGRLILVDGCDHLAAGLLVQRIVGKDALNSNLLKQMGCSSAQLEVVHIDLRHVSQAETERIQTSLCSISCAQECFVKAFAVVGTVIHQRWTCSLGHMGDVQMTDQAYQVIKEHYMSLRSQHWIPHWLLGALFFVLHQMRFSTLMLGFAHDCTREPSFWEEQTEPQLEQALSRKMRSIVDAVMQTWTVMRSCKDPAYIVERDLIPSRCLSWTGGYERGPRNWPYESFPYKSIGSLMCKMLTQCASDVDGKKFDRLRSQLHDAQPYLADLESEEPKKLGDYFLTHKARTWMDAEGVGHKVTGWSGGVSMSATNTKMHQSLGAPSPQQFASLLGASFTPVEAGFHLCSIGEVVRAYLQDKQGNLRDATAVENLVRDLQNLDWRQALSNDEKWVAAKRSKEKELWSHCTWHLPLGKLEICKAHRAKCHQMKRPGSPDEMDEWQMDAWQIAECSPTPGSAAIELDLESSTSLPAAKKIRGEATGSAEDDLRPKSEADPMSQANGASEQQGDKEEEDVVGCAEEAQPKEQAEDEPMIPIDFQDLHSSDEPGSDDNSDDDNDGERGQTSPKETFSLLQRVWTLQSQVNERVQSDDFVGAAPYATEKKQLTEQIISGGYCEKCTIAQPGKHAAIRETWYQSVCGYCHTGAGVRGDGAKPSRESALTSVRTRVLAELQQVLEHLQDLTEYKRKPISQAIRNLKAMFPEDDHKVLKQARKTIVAPCFAGQLVRTRCLLCHFGDQGDSIAAIDSALLLMGYGAQHGPVCSQCGIQRPHNYVMDKVRESWYQNLCGFCHTGKGLHGGQTNDATSSMQNRIMSELEAGTQAFLRDHSKFKRKQISTAITELKKMRPKSARKQLKQRDEKHWTRVSFAGQLARTRSLLLKHGGNDMYVTAIDSFLRLMGVS